MHNAIALNDGITKLWDGLQAIEEQTSIPAQLFDIFDEYMWDEMWEFVAVDCKGTWHMNRGNPEDVINDLAQMQHERS